MAAIITFLLELDYQILKWINQTAASPLQDRFFPWVTDLHKQPYFLWVVYPLILIFFVRKYRRIGITLYLFLLLALGCNDFTGSVVKNQFLRKRPFENMEIVAVQRSPAGSKSFYSNHTSNMFTFATYAAAFFPGAQIPLFAFASTIGYSRIYNGVHYPSDVVAGAVMGTLWGSLFAAIGRALQRRFKKKEIE